MATNLRNAWLADFLEIDPATLERYGNDKPGAGNATSNAANGRETGAAAGNAADGAGQQSGETKGTPKLSLVKNVVPSSAGGHPASAGAQAGSEEGEDGAGQDDAGGGRIMLANYTEAGPQARPLHAGIGGASPGVSPDKVFDKVVEIGEKVVTGLIDNTKITNDSHHLDLLPEGVKPGELLDGATGHIDYTFGEGLTNLFGMHLIHIQFSLSYMFCTVAGSHGKFLKDIRLLVSGETAFGVSVAVKATYGTPGNAGKSPKDWIVDMLVDIDIEWNSGHISKGRAPTLKLRLNGEKGAIPG